MFGNNQQRFMQNGNIPNSGVNENILQENLNADMVSGMDGMFPNDHAYGEFQFHLF